ncbi:hypothetical protein COP1_014658 [Malus domestica]
MRPLHLPLLPLLHFPTSISNTHLKKSCGLSPDSTISASIKLQFEPTATHNLDSVLSLFRAHELTRSHIKKLYQVTEMGSNLNVNNAILLIHFRDEGFDTITSSGSENLAEPLLGVSEILVVEPLGGFRVLGLSRGHELLGTLILLLGTLTLGLDGLEETPGRVRLELEVAVLAAKDPGDDELPDEGILVKLRGVGFGLGLRWRECDVELLRR